MNRKLFILNTRIVCNLKKPLKYRYISHFFVLNFQETNVKNNWHTIIYFNFSPDEIFLRKTTTRVDLIEPSMAIWSGHFSRCSDCASKCIQEPDCVSLLYNMANESCDLFNVIYDSDNGGDIDYYWVLEDRGTRWGKLDFSISFAEILIRGIKTLQWKRIFPLL